MKLSGYKGHVTNIPRTIVPVRAIIGNYRDLWHVELSFRMSTTDVDARPLLHRTGDAIEANLGGGFPA